MIHPDVQPLEFLLGRWVGVGHGAYPTIHPFSYREVVEIAAMPGPALSYGQRTSDAVTGEPRHAEQGYLRMGVVEAELVICQPTGIVEVHAGRLQGQHLHLESRLVGLTPSASAHAVESVHRMIEVDGDVLRYELHMSAVGQRLQRHLHAELHRA